MIERLRRSFILVTVSLVTLVLVAVLGMNLYSASRSYGAAIDSALQAAVLGSLDVRPWIGTGDNANASSEAASDALSERISVPVFSAELSIGGVVVRSNDFNVHLSSETLEEVVDEIFNASSDTGTLAAYHLRWRRLASGSSIRIAVADTSTFDKLLHDTLVNDLLIVVVAVAVLTLITYLISRWILAPVERSWAQQRQFVADASHELKTPLAVIKADVSILQEHGSDLGARDVRWIDSIAAESARMQGLVEEMLELARADEELAQADRSYEQRNVDLSELVENVSLEFDAIAYERNCSIQSRVAQGVSVMGDASALERLVKILIENATKYAQAGSSVQVVLEPTLGHARLAVTNFGEQVPASDLPHLFDRFYRSDAARTRGNAPGGYGLGLAIAKAIADAHHAEISVSSSAEAGTTFTVVFP